MTLTEPGNVEWLNQVLTPSLRIFDLGRQLVNGMPQSPNHPPFWHSLPRRHGDLVRGDGGSAANDHISMGTHVGTHIDALSHVSHLGCLHGGVDAAEVQIGGRMQALGVETIGPMFRRGVLIDVATGLGLDSCAPGYEITPNDLEAAVDRQGVRLAHGDVALIRSGWGAQFDAGSNAEFLGQDSGVPGVGADGAEWLAQHDVHAVGADTVAFERLAPGAGHGLLPAHRVLLVEHGVYIIETLALDELARAQAYEFLFVLIPLNILGATGSPVRPIAVTGRV